MADLYVLTDAGCYLLFPPDTSPEKPFYFTGPTGAGTAWSNYPSQFYIDLQTQVFFGGKANWIQTDGAPPSPMCGLVPIGGINLPHLEKPAWLMTFLASCNWQVFTWYINPGEWIEEAIDWVLDGINDLLDLGEGIANKAIEAWETLKTLWGDITDAIERAVGSVWNEVQDFGDRLDGLWDDITDWVSDRLDDMEGWLVGIIGDLARQAERLSAQWDEFWRYTLPGLIDKFTLDDIILAALAPVFDAVNRLTDLTDSLRDLIDDPEKWLLDKLETMLARFI